MTSEKFNHSFAAIPKIKQVNTPEGRRYEIDDGSLVVAYPSITTVLSSTADKTWLHQWRARVGEEKANAISRNATARGTKMHDLCEKYLLNEDLGELGNDPGELMFKTILPSLERINNVRCLEVGLYSHTLKVAGMVDCIGEFDGKLAVIDFKTSRREKHADKIEDYYMQACFYFAAYHEITGELPQKIVILVSVQDGTNQVFELGAKEIIHYTEKLQKRIEAFYYNLSNGKGE